MEASCEKVGQIPPASDLFSHFLFMLTFERLQTDSERRTCAHAALFLHTSSYLSMRALLSCLVQPGLD